MNREGNNQYGWKGQQQFLIAGERELQVLSLFGPELTVYP